MSINKKVSKWANAEIISEEQAQRIEFEKGGGLIRWTNGLYSFRFLPYSWVFRPLLQQTGTSYRLI